MNKLETKIKLEIIGADIVVEDLDISVELKKTNEATPNYCTVTIYNLSDNTNNRIKDYATGARVYISQSGSDSYELVFEGNLRDSKKFKKPAKAKSKYTKTGKLRKIKKSTVAPKYNSPSVTTEFDDTDVRTIMELQDGRKIALLDTYFSKSYSGKITNRQVINDILNNFRANSIPIGKIDTPIEIEYKNGKVFHGSAVSILRSLCSTAHASFYIKNGVISITNGTSVPQAYVVLLDGTNCARPEEDTNKEIKIDGPLLPTLNPNDWIMLDFKNVKGAHKIYKIESKFDNFGEASGSDLVVKVN